MIDRITERFSVRRKKSLIELLLRAKLKKQKINLPNLLYQDSGTEWLQQDVLFLFLHSPTDRR